MEAPKRHYMRAKTDLCYIRFYEAVNRRQDLISLFVSLQRDFQDGLNLTHRVLSFPTF